MGLLYKPNDLLLIIGIHLLESKNINGFPQVNVELTHCAGGGSAGSSHTTGGRAGTWDKASETKINHLLTPRAL